MHQPKNAITTRYHNLLAKYKFVEFRFEAALTSEIIFEKNKILIWPPSVAFKNPQVACEMETSIYT